MSENEIQKDLNSDAHSLHVQQTNTKIRRERVILNNPVIMQGIGLAPLIVAATSAYSSYILSIAVIILLTPTRFFAAILSNIVPYRFKGPLYALCAALMFIPAYFVITNIFSEAQIIQVGLYLPLLVVDPIILKRYERTQNEKIGTSIVKGIKTTVGYVLVLMLIGCLREFLGAGSIFGFTIINFKLIPIALLPSGGFIILALVMLIWRRAAQVIKNLMLEGEEDYHR